MSSVGHCDEIENVSEKSIKKKKNAKTKKEKRTKSKVEESNDENENKGNETETNVHGFLENKKDEKGKNEAERKAEKNSNLTKDEEDKTSSLSKFDIFDESPDATDLRKFDTWKILEKIARILFCGFLFIFVLGSSFISRITFHILIANLNPPTNFTTMNKFGGHYVTNSFNETVSMTPAVVNVSWIWALYISMIAPYIYNFFYYLLNICMKYDHKTDEEDDTRHLTVAEKAQGNTTNNKTIRIVMYILGYICLCILQAISETVALMYFLPTFDPSTAAVLSIVFFMTWPCLSRCFQTVSSGEKNVDDNDTGKKRHLICLKICSFCLLALSIILMIVYVCLVGSKLDDRNLLVGLTFGVFALALSDTSCFENAIASSKTLFMRRNVISTVGNIIKVPVSFLGVIAIFVSRSPSGLETQSFEVLFYISQNVSINMIDQDIILSSEYSFQNNCVRGHPFIAAVVCVISGYLGFKASYIACRINLQRQSFVVPMILSFIATPFILWSIGNSPQKWNTGACDLVPDDWLIDTIELDFNFIPLQITSLVAALVCLILQVKPIWMNGRKLASLNEIFITPLYNGRCLDVSLLLSREISEAKKTDEKKNTTKIRPYIYMCATMWHEDRQEMKTLLRSIFRFYLKQLVIHFKEEKLTKQKHNKNKNDRKTAKSQNANDTRTAESQNENDIESGKEEQTTKKTRYCHPHRYDFEVHIFFDDAFEDTHVPNKFAQSFIETIKETGSTEFGGCKFPKPAKYNTPYGARIEWDLWNTLTNKHEDANLDNVKTNEKQRKAASAEEDKDENSVSKVTKEEISKEGDEDGATTASNVPVSEIQDEDHRDANTDNEKREANTDNERKDSNTDDEKIEENTDNEKKDIKTDNVEREPKQSEAEIVEKNKDENDDYGKLVVHLKDKSLIRHKKRWSQVMYVYYLLNLKFQQLYQKMCKVMLDKGEPVDIEKAEEPVKSKLKKIMKLYEQNTFILALDGDVDFKPHAIRLLIDRMTKNLDVGATCGRIIPIGKGPVVWYQKFEYAASHWLQKSTEHVFGCVLCSPGCFSLFRASALMSTDVIKTYTKRPEKPSDHIQYDQGEDRWLSTLLLKSGYKLEYTAASDAHTFAPEGFPEFFRQRRRWSPSTMANLLDILWNTGPITKKMLQSPSLSCIIKCSSSFPQLLPLEQYF